MSEPATEVDVTACCVAVYQSDWAKLLLGDCFHPGGLALTSRLGDLLELDSAKRVVDVACGHGASALHLAATYGCRVIGVDWGTEALAAARDQAEAAGLSGLAEFRAGGAEALPVEDAWADAVLCECSFCLFPDKACAATEFARVLRPGGRAGIADLTHQGDLPPELDSLLAWIACLGDARPVAEYITYLERAGLSGALVETHDEVLVGLVREIRGKLVGAELLGKLGSLKLPAIDFEEARTMCRAAVQAVEAGQLGYALLVAAKPPSRVKSPSRIDIPAGSR